jgi:hypothetical protein
MKLLIALLAATLLITGACKNSNDNKPAYDLVPTATEDLAL